MLEQIRGQLQQWVNPASPAAAQAQQMLQTLAAGAVPEAVLGRLATLLQQAERDPSTLSIQLGQLRQGLNNGPGESGALRTLARQLGQEMTRTLAGQPGTVLVQQSLAFLRQLERGDFGGDTQRRLDVLLLQWRTQPAEHNGVTRHPSLRGSETHSKEPANFKQHLPALLQQVRTELANQPDNTPALTRSLTELVMRLHQHCLAESTPANSMQGVDGQPEVQQRQPDDRQQQQQRRSPEWFDDEGDISINFVTNRAVGAAGSSSTGAANGAYQGDSVFSQGLNVLFLFMQMLADNANRQYAVMNRNAEQSRSAQEMAGKVDALLAELSGQDDKDASASLPQAVKDYLQQNHLEIEGVCGYQNGTWDWIKSGGLNKGDLTAVKGALDNVANRASDFVSSSQLQLQKMMQTYNVCVSLINSLQSMLAEMNKTIAQGIR
ncbi:hypothetical protein [Serratia quinivorans]|uniref:hypothetical protein n=1 Tax=Serratia quinivorans TaxID=137545 RepID=UPI0021BA481B|nr:hypothetical protein [Serratia quinivorans]